MGRRGVHPRGHPDHSSDETVTTRSSPANRGAAEPERVPLFGSWRAIHAAVILCAVTVMALLALFSRWPF
jgi:hypothetical protein